MNSKIYVVATPIGNLGDISLRALEILKSVDLIVSEDTRQTAKILKHYNIKNAQTVYTDERHQYTIPRLIDFVKSGKSIALVSDSGTPLISDPGYKLLSQAQLEGIRIEAVPGPSALIAALSISGLPTDKFTFVGFLPRKGGERKQTIQTYGNLDATMILYESPFRVVKTLADIYDILGDRTVVVAKELTKVYETVLRGPLSKLLDDLKGKKLKGEYVILVAKKGL